MKINLTFEIFIPHIEKKQFMHEIPFIFICKIACEIFVRDTLIFWLFFTSAVATVRVKVEKAFFQLVLRQTWKSGQAQEHPRSQTDKRGVKTLKLFSY